MDFPELRHIHFFRVTVNEVVREDHLHDRHELVVMCAGVYHGWRHGQGFEATTGDVMLFPAGQGHSEENDLAQPGQCYVITFEWSALPPGLPEIVHDTDGRIREMARWLNDQWHWEHPYARTNHDGMLTGVLGELARITQRPGERLVTEIRRYISAHIDRSVSMDDLAGAVHLSKNYLHRRYREAAGLTPMQEIRRMRIAQATLLLQTTDLPLKVIATRVGLADPFSLSHMVRKYAGTSPSEIRRGGA